MKTIAILGAGNMGASLLGGLLKNGYSRDQLWVTDASTDRLISLKKEFSVRTTLNNAEACLAADVVILAVKPQILPAVTKDTRTAIQTKKPLVISVAAGVREKTIQEWLGGTIPIVRAMPNTPACTLSDTGSRRGASTGRKTAG